MQRSANNKFLLLTVLITMAIFTMGASSWLIINEQPGSPGFKANTPIEAVVEINGTSYEGEKTLVGTANMPGVFKYNNATIGTISTAGGTCAIPAPNNLSGNSELIPFTVTFVPDSTWLKNNHYEISNPTALEKTANVKGVAKVGTTYYSNIDLAIDATDSATSSTTIYVSESFSKYLSVSGKTASAAELENYRKLPALTIRQENQTLGSNAILTIPYDETYALKDTNTMRTATTEVYDVNVDKNYNKLQYNVSVSASSKTFTNEGTINICAVVGGGTGGATSSIVAGNHGRLTLLKDSHVTNKGKIYCYGYIDEINEEASGELENSNGAYLETLFTITDHRGGSAYMNLVNIGLIQPYKFKSCPFNRFHMGNITPKLIVNYNAQLLGCAILNMNNEANEAIIKLAGSDSTYILQIPSGSKFIADYNKSTNIAKWDIIGNATLNQLVTKLTLSVLTAEVTTEGILFPITWQYEYHLKPYEDGRPSSVTFNQDVKIMPGGNLTVEEGVSLTANNLIVYDENFVSDPSKNCAPLKYSNPLEDTRPGGELVVNGAMSVGKLGGKVISKNSGAKLSITSQVSTTSHEVTGSAGSATTTADWTQNAQGDICYTGLSNLEKTTYYSDGNQWYTLGNKTITYNSNGGSAIASKTVNATNTDGTGYRLTEEDLAAPTKDHYTFAGWYRDSALTQKVEVGSAVCGDITLYAKWVINTYNIEYNTTCVINGITLNGTANNTLSSFTCETANAEFNEPILPDDVKADYLFDGWYIDSSYNTKVETIKDLLSHVSTNGQTITLYAKWIELVTVYNITYNYDNYPAGVDKPTGWPETATVNGNATGFNGSPTTLPKDSLNTNIGYSQYFVGWYKDSALTQPISTWGSLIPEDSEILDWTVYAEFETKYKLTFASDYPGDEVKSSVDATYSDVWWLSPDELATRKPTIAEVLSPSEIALLGDLDEVLTEEYYYGGEWALTDGLTPFSSLTESNFTNKELTLNVLWKQKTNITVYLSNTTLTLNGHNCTNGENCWGTPGKTITFSAGANSNYKEPKVNITGVNPSIDGVSSGSFVVGDIAITIKTSATACIAAGTLITLADGTQKKVEDLVESDMLLVFDHESGQYVSAPILFIERDGWAEYNVINLEFSNGTTTKLIYEHALFDLTLNKYVYITESNYGEFVGHKFAVANSENNAFENVTLTRAYVATEYTGCYSLVTAYHLNYFIDGMLSIPGGITGLFNYFEYGEGLKYDEEQMQADIEKYGLYTYEDFKEYVSYEVFEYAFAAKYFKVSVGKGLMTYEDILALIERYVVGHDLNKNDVTT